MDYVDKEAVDQWIKQYTEIYYAEQWYHHSSDPCN